MKRLFDLSRIFMAVLPIGAALCLKIPVPSWVLVAMTVATAICLFFTVFFATKQKMQNAKFEDR